MRVFDPTDEQKPLVEDDILYQSGCETGFGRRIPVKVRHPRFRRGSRQTKKGERQKP